VVAKNALWYPLDPLITLAALSQSTTHIGLVATVSSTYLPPHHLARKYASLDQVSHGRSGWKVAGARGHWTLVGTAETIADELEHWFTTGAADGFNVLAPTLPNGLKDFAELVIPELRRRGSFRAEYEGRTLREHLGLARPAHRAASPQTTCS
jgi:alkanesulfonate monooxygenase SsuD/methylene tetrahydromethanopterin reductase-like flavin-dependent oxidoreductase (luciferase family)